MSCVHGLSQASAPFALDAVAVPKGSVEAIEGYRHRLASSTACFMRSTQFGTTRR